MVSRVKIICVSPQNHTRTGTALNTLLTPLAMDIRTPAPHDAPYAYQSLGSHLCLSVQYRLASVHAQTHAHATRSLAHVLNSGGLRSPTRAMLDSTLRPPCVGPWTPTRSLSDTERSERPTREADTRRYRTARSWSPPPGNTRHTIRQIARCVLSFASPHAAHHAAYCTWASGHSRPCPRARVTPPA